MVTWCVFVCFVHLDPMAAWSPRLLPKKTMVIVSWLSVWTSGSQMEVRLFMTRTRYTVDQGRLSVYLATKGLSICLVAPV